MDSTLSAATSQPRLRLPPRWAIALLLAAMLPAQRPLFGDVHEMAPTGLGRVRAIAFGDLDGDGTLDAVIAASGSAAWPGARNAWHRNDGTGVFRDVGAAFVPVRTDDTTAVVLVDVDRDGDLDVVFGTDGGRNRLHRNDGNGSFTDVTATHLPAVVDRTMALASGDVDRDGDADLLVGNAGSPNRLYLNDGSGRFVLAPLTDLPPIAVGATRAVALGDVDGDGDLDAILGNGSEPGGSDGGQSLLYVNDGTGRFGSILGRLVVGRDFTRALALGDVDRDGDLDLLVGNGRDDGAGRVNQLFLNDGGGRFLIAVGALPGADPTSGVAFADVDADGDLDVLVSNRAPAANRLYSNDGTGRFALAPSGALPSDRDDTETLAVADVDGDADVDVLFGSTIYYGSAGTAPEPLQHNRLYLGDGRGRFVDGSGARTLPDDDGSTLAVALGDVDGDGDLDAVVGRRGDLLQTGAANRLYRNDGSGTFTDDTAGNLPDVAESTMAVALGDVDGDGDLDVLFGNRDALFDQRNRLYLNDGTGRFLDRSATHLPAIFEATRAVVLVDVDGDRDLDALVGNDQEQNRLYRNDGTGRFVDTTATDLPQISDATAALAAGDVDGDGDPDLLVGNGASGGFSQDRLYLNDGTGRFTDVTASHLPADAEPTTAVELADVDGDGDLDAVLGSTLLHPQRGSRNRLYVNDGRGVFRDATATGFPARSDDTLALALGDLDADGDVDILVGNARSFYHGGARNRVWRNDGRGTFADTTDRDWPEGSDATGALALGDVDGDGDLDAFVGNWSWARPPLSTRNRLLRNLTRQLAWRGHPRVGKPLTLDVHGAPFGVWILSAAFGTTRIQLPIGTLRLDPASHVLVAAGLLDASGLAAHVDRVPPDTTLISRSVYWQAIVSAPLALTNLETTTLSGL